MALRVRYGMVFVEVVRVDIVTVISTELVVTRYIRRCSFIQFVVLNGSSLSKLTCSMYVWQTTILLAAEALVSKIRALIDMTFFARSAFGAVAESGECSANGCAWVCPNMGVTALGVGTVPAQEMQTSWNSFCGGIMGKVTVKTCLTLACLQKITADGNLIGVVLISTRRTFGACAYCKISVAVQVIGAHV